MAQWNWRPLGSAGMHVLSPAQQSGLRIWRCCSCGLGHNFGWESDPWPRRFMCCRVAKREKNKDKTKQNKQSFLALRQGLVCVPLPFPCAGCLPMTSALLCPRVFSAVGAHSAQRARGLGPQELSPTKGVGGGGERLPRPSAGQSFAVVTQLAPFLMSLSFLAHSPHCDSSPHPGEPSLRHYPKSRVLS